LGASYFAPCEHDGYCSSRLNVSRHLLITLHFYICLKYNYTFFVVCWS